MAKRKFGGARANVRAGRVSGGSGPSIFDTIGSGGSKGGGGGNIFGGVATRAAPPEKREGGLKGLVINAGELVRGAASLPYILPKMAYEDVRAANSYLNRISPDFLQDPFAPSKEELDKKSLAEQFPLVGGTVASFGRTGRRAVSGNLFEEYAKAYKEGTLVGTIVEDAANLSVVAGAAAKGINAAAGGSIAEGVAARTTADTITNKVIPNLEKEVAKTEARVAADAAQSAERINAAVADAAADGPRPRMMTETAAERTQMGDARARLDALKATLDQAKSDAADQAARADQLLQGQSKMLVRSYRVAKTIEHLGGKTAMAPIQPYTAAFKLLGKTGQQFLKMAPGLADRLGQYSDLSIVKYMKEFRPERRKLGAIYDQMNAKAEATLAAMYEALDRVDKVTGQNDDLFHAAAVDLTGAAELIVDGYDRMRATYDAEVADEVIKRIAELPAFDGSVEALNLALDLARYRRAGKNLEAYLSGQVDPAAVASAVSTAEARGLPPQFAQQLGRAVTYGDAGYLRDTVAMIERAGEEAGSAGAYRAALTEFFSGVGAGDVLIRLNDLAALADRLGGSDTISRIEQTQTILRQSVLEPMNQTYLSGEGSATQLTPEQMATRRERTTSNQPDPIGLEDISRREVEAQLGAAERLQAAQQRVDEIAASRPISEAALGDLAGAIEKNVNMAYDLATRSIGEAATNPTVMAEIRTLAKIADDTIIAVDRLGGEVLPDGSTSPAQVVDISGDIYDVSPGARVVDIDEVVRRVADRIERYAKKKKLTRDAPTIAALADQMDFEPLALRGVKPAPARNLEEAVRNETRVEERTRIAESLRRRAKKAAATSDNVVERVARLGADLMDKAAKLDEAATMAQQARERIARSAEEGVVPRVVEPEPWQMSSTQYADRYGYGTPAEQAATQRAAGEPAAPAPEPAAAAAQAPTTDPRGRPYTPEQVQAAQEVGRPLPRSLSDLQAEAEARGIVELSQLPGYEPQTAREAALLLGFKKADILAVAEAATDAEAIAHMKQRLQGNDGISPNEFGSWDVRYEGKGGGRIVVQEKGPWNPRSFGRFGEYEPNPNAPVERFPISAIVAEIRSESRSRAVQAVRNARAALEELGREFYSFTNEVRRQVGSRSASGFSFVNGKVEFGWGDVPVPPELTARALEMFRDLVLQRELIGTYEGRVLDIPPVQLDDVGRRNLDAFGREFADNLVSASEALQQGPFSPVRPPGVLAGAELQGVTLRAAEAASMPAAQPARTSEALPLDVIEPHLTAVADAVDQGKPVPPWVLDEYEPRKVPNAPQRARLATQTPGALRKQAARERVLRENELLDANPEVQRVRAGREAALAAWKQTPEGMAFTGLERQVQDIRRSVVSAADAELVELSDLPQVPYLPDDVSEYYAQLNRAVGAPEIDLQAEAEAIYNRSGTYDRDRGRSWPIITREEAWRQAYNKSWRSLPRAAQEQFARLTDEQVVELMEMNRGRTPQGVGGYDTDPLAFGLDGLIDEYSAKYGSLPTAEQFRRFLEDFERQARARRMVSSGARGGFAAADLDAFLAVTQDGELATLASDQYVRGALEQGTIQDAARSLSEGRAARRAAVVPDREALAARLETEPFPYDFEQMHAVLTDVLGDSNLADEAYTMWSEANAAAQQVGQTIPSFEDAISAIADEGVYPTWLTGESVPAGTAERAVSDAEARARMAKFQDEALAAQGLDPQYLAQLTPDERIMLGEEVAYNDLIRASKELEQLVGKGGGAKVLDQAALRAEADRAAAEAARTGMSIDDARIDVMVRAAKGMESTFLKYGKNEQRYIQALQEHRKITAEMRRWIPERFERERARFRANIDNAPARFRPALYLANEIDRFPKRMADELAAGLESNIPAGLRDEVVLAFETIATDAAKTLDDIVGARTINPDGTVTYMDQVIDPEYFPGGRMSKAEQYTQRQQVRDATRIRTTPRERMRRTGAVPASLTEMRKVVTEQIYAQVRNETARQIEAAFGVRATQVLGDRRMEELAQDYRRNRRRAMESLLSEMADEGYVPWDPRKSLPFVRRGEAMGSFIIQDVDQLTANTLFIPSDMAKYFDSQFRAPGNVERWFRKWYDRPTNAWKGSVLAYSPRWHVNNNLGNFVMATVGGGMSPIEWAVGMQDAYAVLQYDRWKFEVDNAATFGHSAKKVAQLRDKMGRAEQRFARMDPETLAAVRSGESLTVDPRLPQRGSGSAALDPYLDDTQARTGRIRGAIKAGANRSYEFNGFVDDLNRIGVFMQKYQKMTPQELWDFAAKNPELAGLRTIGELRNEAAVRMSLDAMGNFRKMTNFEREWVRRVVPFYAWLRHITKLAWRLSINNPARVAWTMHLSDLYGEAPPYSVLFGSVPFIGSTLLRLPTLNPFQDLMFLPTSGTPAGVVTSVSSAVGPIPKLLTAAVTGVDTRTLQPFRRPPGSSSLSEYGQESITPLLGRPGELAYYFANQFPQGRIGLQAVDTARYGKPILRYPTGQPYKVDGKITPSGRSLFTETSGLLGIPQVIRTTGEPNFWSQTVDVERIRQDVEERRKLQEQMGKNYRGTPAPAAGGGTNIFDNVGSR